MHATDPSQRKYEECLLIYHLISQPIPLIIGTISGRQMVASVSVAEIRIQQAKTLQRYHQILWSRTLPCGRFMHLKCGSGPYYLT